jgi:hypothetical protein
MYYKMLIANYWLLIAIPILVRIFKNIASALLLKIDLLSTTEKRKSALRCSSLNQITAARDGETLWLIKLH